MIGVIAPQEDLVLSFAKDLRSERLAHTQARDHLACHLGCALEVVRCTGGDVVAHELFGHTTAQEHRELVEHLVLGLEEMVLSG